VVPVSLDQMKKEAIHQLIQIGQAIKAERKRRGLTQGELSQLSGVGINFVSQAESGKISIHAGKLIELLNALGMDLVVNAKRERD
jgi:HTH-type transcriptional regulator/antitoxin HipB